MKITIVGTGYVGLVTGTVFAEKGHEVLCIDNNESKIEKLNKGQIPFYEPGLAEMVLRNKEAKRLSFYSQIIDGINYAQVDRKSVV